jgi:hypothetical protein
MDDIGAFPAVSRRVGLELESDEDADDVLSSEEDVSNIAACPVSLSNSFDLIRGINNYRITHGLAAINISRSLMATGCAHSRDVAHSKKAISNECGLHSWSSCCYPIDHSNPNCMHRKALQVTTALKWNIFNVASYELAYEWSGGAFSPVRALDMFVGNEEHRKFILQEGTWADFKWRSIGASVGQRYAYVLFGAMVDPNGDFDQFHVDEHVMELPGCTCTGSPVTWSPVPTLSPAEQVTVDNAAKWRSAPMFYEIEQGQDEPLETQLQTMPKLTEAAAAGASISTNATDTAEVRDEASAIDIMTAGENSGSIRPRKPKKSASTDKNTDSVASDVSNSGDIGVNSGTINVADFLKGLTLST